MKQTTFAIAVMLSLSAAPSLSFAQSSVTFNTALTSDYRYRGISQSRFKPAISAGVDFTAPEGFYVGAWASSIKWIKDWGGDSSAEIDVYAGYKGALTSSGMGFDIGVLQYVYPSAKTAAWDSLYKDPNTTEIYGALTAGMVTAKLSYALTNLFGNYNFTDNKKSDGSYYFDLTAPFALGSGYTLTPHVGYQKVENIANASYTDYALTVSKEISALTLSAAVIGTDADKTFYAAPTNGKNLGRSSLVVAAKYSF